jgi:type IV pilus assembly protein PilV
MLMKGLSQQKGLTLVEIMVAVLVLAVGLAGTAALTLFNVTGTAAAQTYSQATVLADQMADSIRANMAAYESAQFISDPATSSVNCTSGTSCTAIQLAEYDVTTWKAVVAAALPAGQSFVCTDSTPDDGQPGSLACDGAGNNVIKLFWLDMRLSDESVGLGLASASDFHRLVVPVVP